MNNYINQSVHNDRIEQLTKQLQQEKLLKQQVLYHKLKSELTSINHLLKAVNKLAEVMNRKDMNMSGKKKGNSADLRKKEKECRKLQQDLSSVSDSFFTRNAYGILFRSERNMAKLWLAFRKNCRKCKPCFMKKVKPN